MPEPNHPAVLSRAQEQIAKIAGAESSAAVDLRNVWARGYVEACTLRG